MFGWLTARGLCVASVMVLSTCSSNGAPSTTASAPETAAARESPVAEVDDRFDPDVVALPEADPIRRVRAALAVSPEVAESLAVAELEATDSPHRLWWLSARAAREAGTPVEAFATLAAVADSDHPLALWAQLERAKIMVEGDGTLAAELLEPLVEGGLGRPNRSA